MKRTIKFFILLLLVFAMVSCNGANGDGLGTTDTTPTVDPKPDGQEPLVLSAQSKTDYTLIYPAEESAALSNTVSYLQNQFYKNTKASISCLSDESEETAYEILLGNTNRTESTLAEPPAEDEFLIRAVGTKILIQVGGDASVTNALECFFDSLLDTNGVQTLPAAFEMRSKVSYVNFKVATFNIQNGLDVSYSFGVLAQDIVKSGATVVALQEIDQFTERNQYQDTLKILSEQTGFPYYAYHETLPLGKDGKYGIAVLSKYPIDSFHGEWLPRNGSKEPRAALKTVINVAGISLSFVSTHCDGGIIAEELDTIREMVENDRFYVVGGDFNNQNYQMFEVFQNANLANSKEKPLVTTKNGKYIDNLICSGDILIRSAKAIDTNHSDHFMVVADIRIYIQ